MVSLSRAFGGIVGIEICNDRRWPESHRVLGLQGVELICIGYNTPIHYAPDPKQSHLAAFHNNLVMAAGAYQNATWVVGVGIDFDRYRRPEMYTRITAQRGVVEPPETQP